MSIDLKTESILSIRQAAAYLGEGRNGRPVHFSSVVRAITKGSRGVKLEGLRMGSRWITSIEAIQRWAERQTPGIGTGSSVQATTAQRLEASRRVGLELDRLGL